MLSMSVNQTMSTSGLQKVLNILLGIFCFVLIVDPPNVLFHAKNPIFILLVLSFFLRYRVRVNVNRLCLFLLTYFLIVGTFLRGNVAGYAFDYEFTTGIIKAFSPMLLLCWADKTEVFNKMLFPLVCVSVFSLFIVYAMYFSPVIETAIYTFIQDDNDFMKLSRRSFLGIRIIRVFYKTIPLAIIPCSVYCYKVITEPKHRIRNGLLFLIFAMAIIFSGTRANMLSVFFIFAFFWIRQRGAEMFGKVLTYLLIFMFMVFALFLISVFLSEKGEHSNAIKFGHLVSYYDLFVAHPDILLFGQGIGSLFYSAGFGEMVPQTEWTYVELVRYFGVFGALFIIGIFFYPLYFLYKHKEEIQYALPFGLGYFLYLCIAGTNPLLISSTGMLALVVGYSYVLAPYHRIERPNKEVCMQQK